MDNELHEEAQRFIKNLKGSAKHYPNAFHFPNSSESNKPQTNSESNKPPNNTILPNSDTPVGNNPISEPTNLISEKSTNPISEKPIFSFGKSANTFWPQKKMNWPLEYLTFSERYYHLYKKLPDKRAFQIQFPDAPLPKEDSDWQQLLLSLQEPLQARGLPVYDVPVGYLQPNFVLAVGLIVNVHDKRAVAAKLKEANLTTKQWTNLLRVQENRDYFQSRLNEIFDEDAQSDAKVALHKLIVAGDLQAIKHFHELQNIYRPQANAQQNLLVALQGIMEILAKYVSPLILSQVANDIKQSAVFRPEAIESKAS
jgi:hypothetical protein